MPSYLTVIIIAEPDVPIQAIKEEIANQYGEKVSDIKSHNIVTTSGEIEALKAEVQDSETIQLIKNLPDVQTVDS